MIKGLTITLAAVATAWLSAQAFATAPVISTIPSPIVSDGTASTEANVFVYPEALNLDNYVDDTDGTDAAIKWSHWSATGRYTFNGTQPLLTTEDPLSPPTAKAITDAGIAALTGETDGDNKPSTITIRDQKLSPLGSATPEETVPATTGIIKSELVTLYASDGTTVSSTSLWVYTENDGNDRLSRTGPERMYRETFETNAAGWTQIVEADPGSATIQYANKSLCITVGKTGVNMGSWASPYGLAALAKNSVYRVRLDMAVNHTTALQVPLWDVVFQNISADTIPNGDYAYAADYWFLDNVKSDNAIKGPANGRNVFYCWFAPGAVLTPQWNSETDGAFTTAHDPNNDFRMVFRCIDADNAGVLAQDDAGQICMEAITIDKFDLAGMTDVATLYSAETFVGGTEAGSSAAGGIRKTDAAGTSYEGGGSNLTLIDGGSTIRVLPADNEGWVTELTFITPGDSTNPNPSVGEYGDGSTTVDNYPVDWQSDKLYMMEVMVKAPNALGVTNGPDCIRLGFETKTLEMFAENYSITGLDRVGSPKLTAAPFVFFYWTHTRTSETGLQRMAAIKWKLDVFNTDTYNRPGPTDVRNLGGVDFESIKVKSVDIPGMNED